MERWNIEKKGYDVYMIPKEGNYTHLIIFLHGKGDVSDSYIAFFENTEVLPKNIPIKIVLLQSPYSAELFGKLINTSWFPIYEFPLVSKECYDFSQAENAKKRIEKIIDEEAALLNGKYDNIYLGGFSQGACISLLVGLTFEHKIGGIISLSGYLFPEINIREENKDINIFVGHGEIDNIISYNTSKEEMKRIDKFKGYRGYSYQNAEHTITKEEIKDLNQFFTECMK